MPLSLVKIEDCGIDDIGEGHLHTQNVPLSPQCVVRQGQTFMLTGTVVQQ